MRIGYYGTACADGGHPALHTVSLISVLLSRISAIAAPVPCPAVSRAHFHVLPEIGTMRRVFMGEDQPMENTTTPAEPAAKPFWGLCGRI